MHFPYTAVSYLVLPYIRRFSTEQMCPFERGLTVLTDIMLFFHKFLTFSPFTPHSWSDYRTMSVQDTVSTNLTPHASRLQAWRQDSACSHNMTLRREDMKMWRRESCGGEAYGNQPEMEMTSVPREEPAISAVCEMTPIILDFILASLEPCSSRCVISDWMTRWL